MNVRKKWVIIPTIALVLSVGTGTVFAMNNNSPKETNNTSQVKKEEPKIETTVAIEEPPVEQVIAPVVASTPIPVPKLKTADDLKEIGEQTILNLGKEQTEVDCFIEVIGMRYEWEQLTEQFVTAKVTELYSGYLSMCGALYMYKQPGRVDVQAGLYPHGFRD